LAELRCLLAKHSPAGITGSTVDRTAQVDRFQRDPECRIWLGQLQASGTAITLTACRRAIYLELAWTPSANWQSLKRHHRLGQTRSVLGEILTIPNSLDESVIELVERKMASIEALEEEAA
jgi:SWI/SNF-related matrix-associated actin-dependent regulator of chromatin subfamily A-like protein 1